MCMCCRGRKEASVLLGSEAASACEHYNIKGGGEKKKRSIRRKTQTEHQAKAEEAASVFLCT